MRNGTKKPEIEKRLEEICREGQVDDSTQGALKDLFRVATTQSVPPNDENERLTHTPHSLDLLDDEDETGMDKLPDTIRNADPGAPYDLTTSSRIGEGTMGVVCRVRDSRLNRGLAAKVIQRKIAGRHTDVKRFINEAQVTAQLQHPGVVGVHELGRLADGRLYFTMDEVRGQSLSSAIAELHSASMEAKQWTRSRSGWTLRGLLGVFHSVCDTVAFAHSRGVVHRDLKPDNIQLGSYGEVRVLDWGLAKVLGRKTPASRETAPDLALVQTDSSREGTDLSEYRSMAGTVAFMAPEQARCEQHLIGPATDVFALGGILYYILAGRSHLESRNYRSALRELIACRFKPPGRTERAERGPAYRLAGEAENGALPVPYLLQEICLAAMSSKPHDRYPDAGALAREIRDWLDGAKRREQALEVIESAQKLLPDIAATRAQAELLHEQADRLLEKVQPHAHIDEKRSAWLLQDRARELERQAGLAEAEMVQLAQGAMIYEPNLEEAREILADHFLELHRAAEVRRDHVASARLEAVLRSYATAKHAPYLSGQGALTLVTSPRGALATLARYELQDRRLVRTGSIGLGVTPLLEIPVETGSYLVTFEKPGRISTRYPVQIGHGEHWDGICPGGTEPFPIYLPERGELETTDIYVPAGPFLCGGDFVTGQPSLPYQKVWLDGFVIKKFPVTNREYLEFLNDLVEQGRENDALKHAPRDRTKGDADAAIVPGRDADGRFYLRPDADGDTWDSEWPVFLINWYAAYAYGEWLRERTGHSWRLPWEMEWEKAARGVDGRHYPWGDFIDPTWCLIRESHQGRHLPAPVTAFPSDSSPYGVRGMAGGVLDCCLDPFVRNGPRMKRGDPAMPLLDESSIKPESPDIRRSVRGGAWNFMMRATVSTRRQSYDPFLRDFGLGFRLARPLAPRR